MNKIYIKMWLFTSHVVGKDKVSSMSVGPVTEV